MEDPVDWKAALGPELGAEVAGVGRDLATLLLGHFQPMLNGQPSPGVIQDDRWTRGELAWAAICYTAPGEVATRGDVHPWVDPWPWDADLDRRPGADTELGRRIDAAIEGLAFGVREVLRLRRKRIALAQWYDRAKHTPVPATATRAASLRLEQGSQNRGDRPTVPPSLAVLPVVIAPEPRLGQRIRWRTENGTWDLLVTGIFRDSSGALHAVFAGPKRWTFDGTELAWPPVGVELVDP